jgi:hypothetical protein
MKLGISTALLVLLGTACAAVPSSPGEGAQGSADAMKRERPQASAGVDVSMLPASLRPDFGGAELEPGGRPCGASLCNEDHYCCNESCGICAPRGGACLQRQCGPAALPLRQCSSNADCHTISSYCDGCQCLPGNVLDPEPTCLKPLVACFVDPCRDKYAACLDGICKLMEN